MPPPKKKAGWPYRKHKDQPVKPVKYAGKQVGHGNYMAGVYADGENNGELVCDANGRPIPYKQIQ